MAAERNFFHRWRGMTTIGYELGVIWEMSVYYAGHGVQVGGENFLVPVNVDIQTEADVDIEAVSANGVQGYMAFAGNDLNIIVMDACRNNPFKRSFRSASRGLAKMDASKGT